jgi:hypothetical protein
MMAPLIVFIVAASVVALFGCWCHSRSTTHKWKGEQGDQGDQGEQGDQGDQGEQGEQGDQVYP